MYKIDKQQGYTVLQRELYSLSCNNLSWSITCKNTESLCCTPETNTILYSAILQWVIYMHIYIIYTSIFVLCLYHSVMQVIRKALLLAEIWWPRFLLSCGWPSVSPLFSQWIGQENEDVWEFFIGQVWKHDTLIFTLHWLNTSVFFKKD